MIPEINLYFVYQKLSLYDKIPIMGERIDIEPDIVGLVGKINSNVNAYREATGDVYTSTISRETFEPLFQGVKNRLLAEDKDTSEPTIILRALLEADARIRALTGNPNDPATIRESIIGGKLEMVSNILWWLDNTPSTV